MRDAEAELREQLTQTFSRARYPVTDPLELVPILPDGPATEFTGGDVVIPAIELGTEYGDHLAFPYDSVDALVDDVIAALHTEDVL